MNERERLGKALKWHRNEVLGLYQFQLGQLLGYGEKTVKRAEGGRPTRPYLECWLKEFEPQEPELAAQVRQVLAALEADDGRRCRGALQPSWVAWTPPAWGRLDPSDPSGSKDTPMQRRAFLTGSLAVPAGVVLETGPSTVKDWEHITQALRRSYSYTSGQRLMSRVTPELDALGEQLGVARGDTLQGLLRSYAELHRLAGSVAHWDLLDDRLAAKHVRQAAHAAYQVDDTDIFTYILALHAHMCRDDRISEGVQAAEEASRLVQSSRPASVAHMHLVAAEMHARAGNERDAMIHLENTRKASLKVKAGSTWRGRGAAPHPAVAGTFEAFTLQLLGRYDDAVTLLQNSEHALHERKDRATHASNLSRTLLGQGELEAAAVRAADAYAQAQPIGYATTLRTVKEIYLQLAPHDSLPAVRELGDQLRA